MAVRQTRRATGRAIGGSPESSNLHLSKQHLANPAWDSPSTGNTEDNGSTPLGAGAYLYADADDRNRTPPNGDDAGGFESDDGFDGGRGVNMEALAEENRLLREELRRERSARQGDPASGHHNSRGRGGGGPGPAGGGGGGTVMTAEMVAQMLEVQKAQLQEAMLQTLRSEAARVHGGGGGTGGGTGSHSHGGPVGHGGHGGHGGHSQGRGQVGGSYRGQREGQREGRREGGEQYYDEEEEDGEDGGGRRRQHAKAAGSKKRGGKGGKRRGRRRGGDNDDGGRQQGGKSSRSKGGSGGGQRRPPVPRDHPLRQRAGFGGRSRPAANKGGTGSSAGGQGQGQGRGGGRYDNEGGEEGEEYEEYYEEEYDEGVDGGEYGEEGVYREENGEEGRRRLLRTSDSTMQDPRRGGGLDSAGGSLGNGDSEQKQRYGRESKWDEEVEEEEEEEEEPMSTPAPPSTLPPPPIPPIPPLPPTWCSIHKPNQRRRVSSTSSVDQSAVPFPPVPASRFTADSSSGVSCDIHAAS